MTDARSGTTGLSGPAPILAGLAIMTSMALAACSGDAPMEAEPATPVPIMLMEAPSDPEAIRPFTIDVPEEVLVDLQNRLARARLPDQIPGTGMGLRGQIGRIWKSCSPTGRTASTGVPRNRSSTGSTTSRRSSTGWTCTSSTSGLKMKTPPRCC